MKKYQIGSVKTKASVGIDIKGSYVISALKSFFEELKKDFKDVNIEVTSTGRGEKPFFIMISRLKDQDEYVGWLIGEKLGELGWEPFAIENYTESNQEIIFRKTLDEYGQI